MRSSIRRQMRLAIAMTMLAFALGPAGAAFATDANLPDSKDVLIKNESAPNCEPTSGQNCSSSDNSTWLIVGGVIVVLVIGAVVLNN